MTKPLEVTFQGVEKSEAIEAKIAQCAAKLEKHFSRLTSLRVVVAAPHRHSQKGKIYQIKIEAGLPERPPLVIIHDPDVSHANQDLPTAIKEAFEAATRSLDDKVARISGTAKAERGRRRPSPVKS